MNLVTVITATHNRPMLLRDALKSVAAQTHREIEHLVVADGPQDCDVRDMCKQFGARYVELGRNWHEASGRQSWGALSRMVGCYMARGEYIAYLDDDNEYLPDHVASLVGLLEGGADFAYSKFQKCDLEGKPIKGMGCAPPRESGLDTSVLMHRPSLLNTATWKAAGYNSDWNLVSRWLEAGASYAFLDRVTVRYLHNPDHKPGRKGKLLPRFSRTSS